MRMTPLETIKNYEQALANQNWDSVAEYFHNDCVVIFSEATYYGKLQVGMAIDKTFSIIKDESFKLSDIKWIYQSELFATCVFNYTWSGTMNKKTFSSAGRGTLAMVKTDDGWQIITEHLGPLPH